MTVQKTPTKPIEVAEKKVEASPGRSAAEVTQEIKDENASLIEGNVEADTTIMEGVQDEDNLSNVSDSDDEILNREEVSKLFSNFRFIFPMIFIFQADFL